MRLVPGIDKEFEMSDKKLCGIVALLLLWATTARAQYTFTNIADTSNPAITGFVGPLPSLNSAGTLGYCVFLAAGGQELFTGDGTTTTPIAVATGSPYFVFGIGSPGSFAPLTATGAVGFRAELGAGQAGLYRSDGTTTATIALTSGPTYDFVWPPSMNAAGTLGFIASLDSGGEGLFTSDGVTTTTIALTSGPIYKNFGVSPMINSGGTLGFMAELDTGGWGLFTSNGTTTTTIALASGPMFSAFTDPSINASGKLGFNANLESGVNGIFTSDGTTTTTIALPGLTYSNFVSIVSIDSAGRVAFNAGLQAGGRGLFIGDGTTTIPVLHTGDALFGSTVIGFAVGREGLNDAGQVGFFYQLANGRNGVAIATPAPEPGCQSCPGDMDGNFAFNGNDVQRFIQCFIAAAGGAPTATCECSDVLVDSIINSQDITEFVNRLLSPPACP